MRFAESDGSLVSTEPPPKIPLNYSSRRERLLPGRLFTFSASLSLAFWLATWIAWKWVDGGSAHHGNPPPGWTFLAHFGFRWKIIGVAWPGDPIYATNLPHEFFIFSLILFSIAPALWLTAVFTAVVKRHHSESR